VYHVNAPASVRHKAVECCSHESTRHTRIPESYRPEIPTVLYSDARVSAVCHLSLCCTENLFQGPERIDNKSRGTVRIANNAGPPAKSEAE
jgi:hypothetical protein